MCEIIIFGETSESLHSDWLSSLGQKGWPLFQMSSNSFVTLEINLQQRGYGISRGWGRPYIWSTHTCTRQINSVAPRFSVFKLTIDDTHNFNC